MGSPSAFRKQLRKIRTLRRFALTPPPARTPRTSPVDEVLQSYELLQLILLCLSFRDLFVCQRLSKTWRGLMYRSHPILKKMFLMADGDPRMPVSMTGLDNSLTYLGVPHMIHPAINMSHESRYLDVVLNNTGRKDFAVGRRHFHQDLLGVSFQILDCAILGCEGPSELQPKGSWRQMLVAPVVRVSISATWKSRFKGMDKSEDAELMTVYNRTGVTFGDLEYCAKKICEEYELEEEENRRPSYRDFTMGIGFELPLANEALNKAVRDCKKKDGECDCLQLLQQE